MQDYQAIFKALGDETRCRILRLLIKSQTELCCCELTDSLKIPQYNISRHLKILKNVNLVEDRKEGRWVYSFLPKKPSKFLQMLFKIVSLLPETPELQQDFKNLKARLRLRVEGKCIFGVEKTGFKKFRKKQ